MPPSSSNDNNVQQQSYPEIPLLLRVRRDTKRRNASSSNIDTSAVFGGGVLNNTTMNDMIHNNSSSGTGGSTISSSHPMTMSGGGGGGSNHSNSSNSNNNTNYISLYHVKDIIQSCHPKDILALAVRYDESRQDETLLSIPLEAGRLYNSDPYQFVRALEYLQQYKYNRSHQQQQLPSHAAGSVEPSSSSLSIQQRNSKYSNPSGNNLSNTSNSSRNSNTTNNNSNHGTNSSLQQQQQSPNQPQTIPSTTAINQPWYLLLYSWFWNRKQPQPTQPKYPPYAITPIILSGILSAFKEQRDDSEPPPPKQQPTAPMMVDISSELVLTCQNLRRAAITRIRNRKKRHQIQRIVIPIAVVLLVFILYLRSMSNLRSLLIQLGYVKSCDGMPAYAPACFLSEATLWYKYRNYLVILRQILKSCKDNYSLNHDKTPVCRQDHTILQNRYREAPFTLHTTLLQDLITYDELNTGIYTPSLVSSTTNQKKVSSSTSLRWLGESTVNRLVREAIDTYLPSHVPRHILDAGCGVGGTLFALLPEQNYRTAIANSTFRYHGIAASGAEIAFARGLVRYHNLDSYDDNIIFEQRSFEERLTPNSYTVIVAIESLSFSRNVENTIANLLRALRPGGVFIMVEDTVYPTLKVATDEWTIRPSLFSHNTWKSIFDNTISSNNKNSGGGGGWRLKEARDLSLEYDIIHDTYHTGPTISSTNGGTVYENTVHCETTARNSNDRSSTKTSLGNNKMMNGYYGGSTILSWIIGQIQRFTTNVPSELWSSYFFDSRFSILLLERWLAQTGNAASQRLIELQDEQYLLAKLLRKRKEAYKQTILSYNFFVCVKEYNTDDDDGMDDNELDYDDE